MSLHSFLPCYCAYIACDGEAVAVLHVRMSWACGDNNAQQHGGRLCDLAHCRYTFRYVRLANPLHMQKLLASSQRPLYNIDPINHPAPFGPNRKIFHFTELTGIALYTCDYIICSNMTYCHILSFHDRRPYAYIYFQRGGIPLFSKKRLLVLMVVFREILLLDKAYWAKNICSL